MSDRTGSSGADGPAPGRWLRPELADLPVYLPGTGAPPGYRGSWHKLSSNESPYPPPAAVLAAIERAAEQANRYPPIFGEDLALSVARHHGLVPERVAVAGGSLVLLQQAVQATASPGDEVVFAWRSYEAYPIIVRTARCRPVAVPLTDHRLDLQRLAESVTDATRVVIACSPNNPTGTDVTPGDIEEFLRATAGRCLVVLDQAYKEFADRKETPDGLALQSRFEHVLVLRTFSKAHNLAGARIGWCAGHPEIVSALQRVALPFTLNRLASAAASASLEQAADETADRVSSIVAERDRVSRALRALGFEVPVSQANFVWLPLGPCSLRFAECCGRVGVSVRCFDGEGVRVTIGAPPDNDLVLEAAASHMAR